MPTIKRKLESVMGTFIADPSATNYLKLEQAMMAFQQGVACGEPETGDRKYVSAALRHTTQNVLIDDGPVEQDCYPGKANTGAWVPAVIWVADSDLED